MSHVLYRTSTLAVMAVAIYSFLFLAYRSRRTWCYFRRIRAHKRFHTLDSVSSCYCCVSTSSNVLVSLSEIIKNIVRLWQTSKHSCLLHDFYTCLQFKNHRRASEATGGAFSVATNQSLEFTVC